MLPPNGERNALNMDFTFCGLWATLYCFQPCRFCAQSHNHATPALLLVVIWLVAHGDFLLLNLAELFAVNVYPRRRGRWGIPDDLSHRTKKSSGAEQNRWITLRLHVVEEELCVLVPMACGLGEPIRGHDIVPLHILPQEVQPVSYTHLTLPTS